VLSNTDLRVVVLVEAVIRAVFHDARVGVGEIVLILVTHPRGGRVWGLSTGPPTFTLGLFLSLSDFGFVLRLLPRVAFLCPCLQDGFGSRQVVQAFRQIHFALIRAFSQRQHLCHFSAQAFFQSQ